MKVWLLCGDCYHPAAVPKEGLAAAGIAADVLTDACGVTLEALRRYDVVVLAKGNKTSEEDASPWEDGFVGQAFEEYVREGGGVLFMHAGAAVKKGADELCRLMGHRFLQHPEQCPVTVAPLKPHPITRGVSPFTVQDEHYFLDLQAQDADILLASASRHGVQAAGYTRELGKGRVCTLTPGHNPEVWLEPSFQKIIQNAIDWCGKGGRQ